MCFMAMAALAHSQTALPESGQALGHSGPAAAQPPVNGTNLTIQPAEYPEQSVWLPQVSEPPHPPRLTPWSAEIQKLVQAGIEDDVLLSFIDTAGTFNLVPEQIIYLRDLGVSTAVINAMIRHDAEIISGIRQVIASTVPNPELLLPPQDAQTIPARADAAKAPPEATVPGNKTNPAAEQGNRPEIAAVVRAQDQPTEETLMLPHEQPVADLPKLFPVREPYPVPLTDPIIVRGEPRIPNVQVLVWFR